MIREKIRPTSQAGPFHALIAGPIHPIRKFQRKPFVAVFPPNTSSRSFQKAEGRETLWGRATRNLAEEEGALRAGLAPGQVRRGLRLTKEVIHSLEHFAKTLDVKRIHLEALFYHNVIVYERCGFSYFEGFKRMQRIHQAFQPGGKLFQKLDAGSPFRQPGFEKTVRGRCWAIHDGVISEIDDDILKKGWFPPKMYLMVR